MQLCPHENILCSIPHICVPSRMVQKKGSPKDTIHRLKTPKDENNHQSATVFPQGSLQSAFPAGKSKHHCLLFKASSKQTTGLSCVPACPMAPFFPGKKAGPALPAVAPSDLKAMQLHPPPQQLTLLTGQAQLALRPRTVRWKLCLPGTNTTRGSQDESSENNAGDCHQRSITTLDQAKVPLVCSAEPAPEMSPRLTYSVAFTKTLLVPTVAVSYTCP